ncbi:uncharacterized protein LOC124363305 [Homalodisca vitripennis]|uniref:uncharacterized protein LOC124363305 n=1 Tax=Homalodisca vitripennis TaxID=197043 RepID=UPI001EEB32DD|nr:uncharacterized protein LOC124363305 [Homalodisca vitripennis]
MPEKQSHRQQVQRLESQVQLLRDQLSQEVKRRQMYVLRSSRMDREASQLRQVLGDSLSRVSQDPSLDAGVLEQEARKLDTSLVPLALPAPRPPHPPQLATDLHVPGSGPAQGIDLSSLDTILSRGTSPMEVR